MRGAAVDLVGPLVLIDPYLLQSIRMSVTEMLAKSNQVLTVQQD
jgi:hypothetical protein